MPPLFRFESVVLERDGRRLLDGVTFDIDAPTGITAVVGASGSGKSTLLRCCNLLDTPDAGRIEFRGEDLAVVDPLHLRREVAMVFQQPTVFAGTTLDNLRAADPGIGEAAAVRLLDTVGLPAELLGQEADTLSGGEAQRLCLARALATEPQVILADEVTSALDAEATAVLENLLRTVSDTVAVIWVSHSAEQVRRIADRVLRIDAGKVLAA
ncbi:MAG: ABC transporter ATP-binding protein [Mycobacteriaceae bacterium]|uniref:ABC transporter ATP-binding protein n=1 Tax=Corynebacterium sp. TaxID=1720 RepID=UPI003F94F097